ncbi:hypothetical protein DFH29DRAFT_122830 [Suillus ampliporus]|nr:hypothetical protein DFH29DRAFT_122830 [Suillus ampliporus]
MCYAVMSARGESSLLPQNPVTPVTYNSVTLGTITEPNQNLCVYYHVHGNQWPYIFPIDSIIYFDTLTTSTDHPKLADFKDRLSKINGGSCVVNSTNVIFCRAAHLVGIGKGEKYIEALTTNRLANLQQPQIIDNMNDLRNGPFVSHEIHCLPGEGVAFIPILNLCMNRNDNLSPEPDHVVLHDLNPPSNPAPIYNMVIPSGGLLRVAPQDWPRT